MLVAPAFTVDTLPFADAGPVHVHWGLRIPMRDGARLNATLYEPRDRSQPLPAVFMLSPYGTGNTFDEARARYFAAHGFVFLNVDVRGHGNAGGRFDHAFDDGDDGHDAVEWLAHQPFCNGKVAMWGGSYLGQDQWATARTFPPHLATIVPAAAAHPGIDFPARNNISTPYEVQWLQSVAGAKASLMRYNDLPFWIGQFKELFKGGRPFIEFDDLAGYPSATFREWTAHPEQGPYWDALNPSPKDFSRFALPILTITGDYDDDQPGALAYYRDHMKYGSAADKALHYLVIGPWDHGGTRTPHARFGGVRFGFASLLDINELHRQWYEWTMRGGSKPEFLKKRVAYYVAGPGAEQWRYADTLEEATATQRVLYLDSAGGNTNSASGSGGLSAQPAKSATPDTYTYDPRDTRAARFATPEDDSLVDQSRVLDGKCLIYHSAPFERDTEVTGFFGVSAWIGMDRPDTDFLVTVSEIRADGSAIALSNDVMRARYRQSLRKATLVPAGRVLRYDFRTFTFVSRVIAKGSRLRLTLGPTDSVYTQKNWQSGGIVSLETAKDAQTIHVQLYHDAHYPSALSVPIGVAGAH